MEFDRVIRDRSATRSFSSKSVGDELINKVVDAGRIAPTAKNLQPIKIYVVKSEDGLSKIDMASRCRYNAPVVLVVCGDRDNAFRRGDHSTYVIDSCIVATHMMLEATNLGIDNIWVDLFDENILVEEFSIPENLVPICIMPIGYRNDDCPVSQNHNVRKNIGDIVEYV